MVWRRVAAVGLRAMRRGAGARPDRIPCWHVSRVRARENSAQRAGHAFHAKTAPTPRVKSEEEKTRENEFKGTQTTKHKPTTRVSYWGVQYRLQYSTEYSTVAADHAADTDSVSAFVVHVVVHATCTCRGLRVTGRVQEGRKEYSVHIFVQVHSSCSWDMILASLSRSPARPP